MDIVYRRLRSVFVRAYVRFRFGRFENVIQHFRSHPGQYLSPLTDRLPEAPALAGASLHLAAAARCASCTRSASESATIRVLPPFKPPLRLAAFRTDGVSESDSEARPVATSAMNFAN